MTLWTLSREFCLLSKVLNPKRSLFCSHAKVILLAHVVAPLTPCVTDGVRLSSIIFSSVNEVFHLIRCLLIYSLQGMFSADMRLSFLSWWNSYNKPANTALGELDYDPFAFDVGCLGVLFWNRFGVSLHSSAV